MMHRANQESSSSMMRFQGNSRMMSQYNTGTSMISRERDNAGRPFSMRMYQDEDGIATKMSQCVLGMPQSNTRMMPESILGMPPSNHGMASQRNAGMMQTNTRMIHNSNLRMIPPSNPGMWSQSILGMPQSNYGMISQGNTAVMSQRNPRMLQGNQKLQNVDESELLFRKKAAEKEFCNNAVEDYIRKNGFYEVLEPGGRTALDKIRRKFKSKYKLKEKRKQWREDEKRARFENLSIQRNTGMMRERILGMPPTNYGMSSQRHTGMMPQSNTWMMHKNNQGMMPESILGMPPSNPGMMNESILRMPPNNPGMRSQSILGMPPSNYGMISQGNTGMMSQGNARMKPKKNLGIPQNTPKTSQGNQGMQNVDRKNLFLTNKTAEAFFSESAIEAYVRKNGGFKKPVALKPSEKLALSKMGKRLKNDKFKEKQKQWKVDKRTAKIEKLSDKKIDLTVVFDLSYLDEPLLTTMDKQQVYKQVYRCQNINKTKLIPLQIHIAGVCGHAKKLVSQGKTWNATIHEKPLLDAFQLEDLVYLTNDSENVIEVLDESKIYVIGAIIEKRDNLHGETLKMATTNNISHARFPIEKFYGAYKEKVFSINQIFSILSYMAHGHTWNEAFNRGIHR